MMKLRLKLAWGQSVREVVSQLVNDLLDEGYSLYRMGPNSMVFIAEDKDGGVKLARIFVLDSRTVEIIKRAG